jgi:hypothetical protein
MSSSLSFLRLTIGEITTVERLLLERGLSIAEVQRFIRDHLPKAIDDAVVEMRKPHDLAWEREPCCAD